MMNAKINNDMDRLVILLGITSSVILFLFVNNAIPWMEGRNNGYIPSLLLNVVCLPLWLTLVIWMMCRIAIRVWKAGIKTRTAYCIIIVFTFIPWMKISSYKNPYDAFIAGFTRWAEKNVDDEAIRQWRSKVKIVEPETPAPIWWPLDDRQRPFGVEVPDVMWSDEIKLLYPGEVRVLADQGVIMAWGGDFFGFKHSQASWVRFVFIGSGSSGPPIQFDTYYMEWRQVRPGVYAGVVYHH